VFHFSASEVERLVIHLEHPTRQLHHEPIALAVGTRPRITISCSRGGCRGHAVEKTELMRRIRQHSPLAVETVDERPAAHERREAAFQGVQIVDNLDGLFVSLAPKQQTFAAAVWSLMIEPGGAGEMERGEAPSKLTAEQQSTLRYGRPLVHAIAWMKYHTIARS